MKIATDNGATIEMTEKLITFEEKSVDNILRTLLGEETEITSRYEEVGHIAHINLRSNMLPHRFIIGKVLLEACQICSSNLTPRNMALRASLLL